LADQMQQHIKKIIDHDQITFISEIWERFSIYKYIKLMHHISKWRIKIITISRDAEKAKNFNFYDKKCFMIKIPIWGIKIVPHLN
jgi:hypothetical protein